MVDMIQLTQNLEDMAEFEPLPPGLYTAEVRDISIGHTEKVPEGFLKVSLMIDPADFPADYDAGNNPEGALLTYARVRIPTGADRRAVRPYKKLLEALGVKATGASQDLNSAVGNMVQVLVSKNEYQGAEVNNVDAVQPLPKV